MLKLAIIAFSMTAALLNITTAYAQPYANPDGLWEIDSADSRYQVTTCGPDGELCGELVWLGNGAETPENLPYLNTLLIDHAVKAGESTWEGQLNLFGQTAAGTITQYANNRIELTGCIFMVLCRSYHLLRIN